jgi:signal transduction histidine kinase
VSTATGRSRTILARQAAAEIRDVPRNSGAGGELQTQAGADPIGNTQFVALVAHELRTPLTALRGNVQLAGMAVRKGDLERVDARLNAALKGVDGISALVQNLQDMSHLERGKFQFARVKGDLAVTVRTAAKRAERLIESDQHTITVETPAEAESYFDPARIEQAVFNMWRSGGHRLRHRPGRRYPARGAAKGLYSILPRLTGQGNQRQGLGAWFDD